MRNDRTVLTRPGLPPPLPDRRRGCGDPPRRALLARAHLLLTLGLLAAVAITNRPASAAPLPDDGSASGPEFTLAQRQRVPRDRRRDRLLDHLRDALVESRLDLSADLVGELLSLPDDTLLADPTAAATAAPNERPHPHRVRAVTHPALLARLLAAHPALLEHLRTRDRDVTAGLYRAAHDRPGSPAAQAARLTLLRRYPFSFEAARLQLETAERQLAAGHASEAAARLASVANARQLPSDIARDVARLQTAAERAAMPTLRQTAAIAVLGSGRDGEAAPRQPSPLQSLPNRWTTASGSVAGVQAAARVQPLPWPTWRAAIARDDTTTDTNTEDRESSEIAAWENDRLDAQSSLAGPGCCVVSSELAIVAAADRILAFHLEDGSPGWAVPRASSRGGRSFEAAAVFDGVTTRPAIDGTQLLTIELGEAGRPSRVRSLDLTKTPPVELWSHDTPAERLLSPILPTPEGLMVLVKRETVVMLRCLDRTGAVRFEQPLTLDETRADQPLRRGGFGVELAAAGGLVLCPTRLGVTAAVEASTGRLRWIDLDPSCLPTHVDRPLPAIVRRRGEAAYPSPILTVGDRVLVMPPESDLLHCLDLQTGRVLWRRPRRDDTCLLGAADGRVFVSGHRTAGCLDLATGDRIWQRRIATPSGRGLVVGSALTLPMSDGTLLRLALSTGAPLPQPWMAAACPLSDIARPARERRMGNLILTRRGLLWCSPTHVARHALAEQQTALLARAHGLSQDDRLLRARVHLASGDADAAVSELAATPEPEVADEWNHLKRECLFAQLQTAGGLHPQAVEGLRTLVETPEQGSRLLLHQLEAVVEMGDAKAALQFGEKLASSNQTTWLRQTALQQTPEAAATEQFTRLTEHAVAAATLRTFVALAAGDATARRRVLRLLGDHSVAASLWKEAAAAAMQRDARQAAELALFQVRRIGSASDRADALVALADLYAASDRPREAANCWHTLETHHLLHPVGGGLTVRDRLQTLPISGAVSRELERRRPFRGTLAGSTITLEDRSSPTWAEGNWIDWYADDRHKVRQSASAGIDVIDLAEGADQASLLLVDRTTPRLIARVPVPPHYWHPPGGRHRQAGHVLPLGTGQPQAVSLLEGRLLWTAEDIVASHRRPKVVYAGPRRTVLQDRETLVAVDTLTGRPLWRRSDLDRRSGLMANESSGVLATSEHLVVFESDGVTFTRYATASGRRIGRGRLEPLGQSVRRPELTSGLRLFYFTSVDGRLRFRARDLATDAATLLFDEPANSRILCNAVDRERLALVVAGGELVVFNLAEGREELRGEVDVDWRAMATLEARCDSRHIYLNPHPAAARQPASFPLSSSDVRLDAWNLDGELIALHRDAVDGDSLVAWRQPVGRCTLLETLQTELPVLLVARRVRELRMAGRHRVVLDVLDRENGSTVASHQRLPRTPLLRMDYEPQARRVRILGETATIGVNLGGPLHSVSYRR